jgi:nucleoside-diphosphate-sugar epimerase
VTGGSILLPGGAGLVGQNLVARLLARGYRDLVVIDKHRANLDILRRLQPAVTAIEADLAEAGDWQARFAGAAAVVMLQAQIGGPRWSDFERNNLVATGHVLDAIREHRVPRLVHVSSSVVATGADDFYTRSKKQQERMVLDSGLAATILRPTLMFGWFDRKHLGWLSRFMARTPVFPIPGDGRFVRQPLYAGDFCNIIIACLEGRGGPGVYDISGHEKVAYVDIIRGIRRATGARTRLLHLPVWLFHALLRTWGTFDRNPPFTTQQLEALVAGDEFAVIDWPGIFGVERTPFAEAIDETFRDPAYGRVSLEF